MASGGWFGKVTGISRLLKVDNGPPKRVTTPAFGRQQNDVGGMAAPAPTVTEKAEYDVSTTRNVKKKRGKNSLYTSSSGTGSGVTGINL